MASVCPRDGTQLVEVERSGVRVDACRTCRGVWLDRGELDKILERESQAFERQDQDDEAFLREVTGGSGSGRSGTPGSGGGQPGFDRKTAERILEEFRGHKQKRHGDYSHGKRRKKSFLDELLG
jgi:Zn-finger nucleic acid-binding protein